MEIEGVCPREGGSKKSIESIRVLVVDDDTASLAIVVVTLKKFKYEVVTAKHANDALSTLRMKGGGFDLVISEVHMPDMNGFELQQAIAQEFKNLPVVLMSDDPDEGVALKGLENGAVFFMYKPVCPDDVRDLWQFASLKKGKKKSPTNKGSNEKKRDAACQAGPRQKKKKMRWTHWLQNRFLEAIMIIGLDRAVPKKILEVMNVPGLTREHVASHLQKYRIFLRELSKESYQVFKASCQVQETPHHIRIRRNMTALGSPLTLNEFPYQKLNFSSPLMSTYNISSIPARGTKPHMHMHAGNVWKARGLNREEAYNPMFHTTYPEQVSILNQAQTHAQQDEGATFTTSNVYGDMSRQGMVEPQDQLVPNTYAQLINDAIILPPPPPKIGTAMKLI